VLCPICEVAMNARSILFQAVVALLVGSSLLCVAFGALAQESGVMDKYLDKYWGEKRKVKVIQKRLFQKDGRHELGIFGGTIPNDEFMMYYPVGARYNYFFSEDLGIELFGSYMIGSESELSDFLADKQDGFGIQIKTFLPQKLEWTAGLEGLWSPVHGKVGLFTSKLFHFDFHLAVGVGAMATEVRTRDIGILEAGEASRKKKYDVAANLGTGVRMYFTDWIALRIEYRHYFYAAEQGGVSKPAELTLGAAFFLN